MKKYVLMILLTLLVLNMITQAETNNISTNIPIAFTNIPIFTNGPTIYTDFNTSAYALQNGLVSINLVK